MFKVFCKEYDGEIVKSLHKIGKSSVNVVDMLNVNHILS